MQCSKQYFYSITSSAVASSDCGMVRPSAVAVLRLMTSSNLVGNWGAVMPKLAINKIKVRNRYRKNLGDISSLAVSIEEVGLLHPIVVRPDGRLIAGKRRLAA